MKAKNQQIQLHGNESVSEIEHALTGATRLMCTFGAQCSRGFVMLDFRPHPTHSPHASLIDDHPTLRHLVFWLIPTSVTHCLTLSSVRLFSLWPAQAPMDSWLALPTWRSRRTLRLPFSAKLFCYYCLVQAIKMSHAILLVLIFLLVWKLSLVSYSTDRNSALYAHFLSFLRLVSEFKMTNRMLFVFTTLMNSVKVMNSRFSYE